MSNIRVDLSIPIYDGHPVTFRSPADCSQVTGLIIYYPDGETTTSKVFQFADAHGNNVGNLDLFAANAIVKVILDTDSNLAFVQNADTNAYLEGEFYKLKQRPNPNLLDNWYFVDPVNQRGQTEYTGAGYTIDRWRIVNSGATILPESSGLLYVTDVSSSGPKVFETRIDATNLRGKTVTVSLLVGEKTGTVYLSEGSLAQEHKDIAVIPNGITQYTFMVKDDASVGDIRIWGSTGGGSSGSSTRLIAAKLELGEHQTLARQDADGNWVLIDPPPDKNEELLKCCMSTADSTDTYANNKRTAQAVGALSLMGGTLSDTLTVNGAVYGQKLHQVPEFYGTPNEIGRYLDMHLPDTGKDYEVRIAVGDDGKLKVFHSGDTYREVLHTGNISEYSVNKVLTTFTLYPGQWSEYHEGVFGGVFNAPNIEMSDTPIIGLVQTGSEETDAVLREEWNKIKFAIVYGTETMEFKGEGSIPTIAIPVQALCIR